MTTDEEESDTEQLDQFFEAWKEFETTHDESALVELLAEDFVWLPTWDAAPEIGKEEMIDHLNEVSGDYHTVEREHRIVRDDWAVEQLIVHGTIVDDETGETEEITFGGNEVYQRKGDGEWEQIISLPFLPFRSIDMD